MRASFIIESTASLPEQHRNTRLSGIGPMPVSRSASAVGGLVGERIEARVRGERAQLLGDGVGDLGATVTDLAVPQAGHPVDELVPVGVPQQGALPTHDADELAAGRLGVRVEEGGCVAAHAATVPRRSARTLRPGGGGVGPTADEDEHRPGRVVQRRKVRPARRGLGTAAARRTRLDTVPPPRRARADHPVRARVRRARRLRRRQAPRRRSTRRTTPPPSSSSCRTSASTSSRPTRWPAGCTSPAAPRTRRRGRRTSASSTRPATG